MDLERLGHLLDRYVDGAIEPEEKVELERVLLASPEARALFWERARFHALLRQFGEQTWGRREATAPEPRKVVAFPRFRGAWLAAAACLLIGGLGLAWRIWPAPAEPMTNGVAVLGPCVDVVWADGVERVAGEVLAPGWLRLKSGLVQVEFVSGARVILEGPAEFQLGGAREGFCQAGRLSVEVPSQAVGFRVASPVATVVDLGTEFGMNVHLDGATDVHVFRGRVEVRRAGETRALGEGENVRVAAQGSFADFAEAIPDFPTGAQLETRAADGFRARYERWRSAAREVAALPGLVLYFDFQSGAPWARALPNASEDAARGPAGSIVGCRWSEGRWPGKGALEFRAVTDRVRVSAPGDFPSYTFSAWVRVDSLDHTYNPLLMADGWQPGDVHWQISRKGELILGVNGSGNFSTRPVFPPERQAQWAHLAVTFDRAAGRVAHYLDGQQISNQPMNPAAIPIMRLDRAELGNWNDESRRDNQPIRNLSGRIDEVLIFRRALGAAEVQALCRAGQGL